MKKLHKLALAGIFAFSANLAAAEDITVFAAASMTNLQNKLSKMRQQMCLFLLT